MQGDLHGPWGICLLPSGDLCIAERTAACLKVVSPNGEARGQVKLPPGEFDDLQDVLCDGKDLWVAAEGRVVKLRLDGTVLAATAGAAGDDELRYPAGMQLDVAAGLLFVCDSGNARVVAYDLRGGASPLRETTLTPLRQFGKPGREDISPGTPRDPGALRGRGAEHRDERRWRSEGRARRRRQERRRALDAVR